MWRRGCHSEACLLSAEGEKKKKIGRKERDKTFLHQSMPGLPFLHAFPSSTGKGKGWEGRGGGRRERETARLAHRFITGTDLLGAFGDG